jgi:aldose 1-epimerase
MTKKIEVDMQRVESAGEGTGRTIRLVDDQTGSDATIAVGYGFNAFSFRAKIGGRTHDFLWAGEGFPSPTLKASHHGTPILIPFPNRIRGGRFHYGGKHYELPCNERGVNAIHGLAIDQPWRTTGQGASAEEGAWVRGEFQLSKDLPEFVDRWPGDFRTSFTYRLRGATLETIIESKNVSDRAVPFGVGTHPYFRFPLQSGASLADCEIVVPADQEVELIECLPTGAVRPVVPAADLRRGRSFADRTFDDVFTGLRADSDGWVRHYLRDRNAGAELEIAHGREFPFVVVYTPPHRESICIEPYTCVTDAMNLQGSGLSTGLWDLQPGESRTVRIRYTARPWA